MSDLTVLPVTVEHHREPIGIGERAPRLSWVTRTELPDWRQAAYELEISPADVAAAIDEIPVLCLAAAYAEGEHEAGAGERGSGAVVLGVRPEAGVADLVYFRVLGQALGEHCGVRLEPLWGQVARNPAAVKLEIRGTAVTLDGARGLA